MTERKHSYRAVLVLAHGSRSPEAQTSLAELARRVANERPDWIVEHAHMELAEPDFMSGIDRLVERGATRVELYLHFLSSGYHVRETIPELIAHARERYPELEVESSAPIGAHPRLVDLILDALEE